MFKLCWPFKTLRIIYTSHETQICVLIHSGLFKVGRILCILCVCVYMCVATWRMLNFSSEIFQVFWSRTKLVRDLNIIYVLETQNLVLLYHSSFKLICTTLRMAQRFFFPSIKTFVKKITKERKKSSFSS